MSEHEIGDHGGRRVLVEGRSIQVPKAGLGLSTTDSFDCLVDLASISPSLSDDFRSLD